jgi:hypothetical protein
MADLSVTIGLDQSELEKGLSSAGKKIGGMSGAGRSGSNPFKDTADQFLSAQSIGMLLGGPLGSLIGAFVDMVFGAFKAVMSKVAEFAEQAQVLRRISIATGISIDQLMSMKGFASAFGVSIQSLSSSFTEFTRRMGEARIKGGELTNILAKMGIGMDEVANGTFNHQKAMMALADAYAAGTDEATLLYYGTKMFGDSFKELLPIIKAGSKAVKDASDVLYKASEENASSAGRFDQGLDSLGRAWDNFLIDATGRLHSFSEKLVYEMDNIFTASTWNPWESLEDEVGRKIKNAPKYMTNDEIKKYVLEDMDEDQRDEAKKELEKQLKGNGKVLTPFGMSEAGAASQMQQMGGGDIFGAVAFTPLERIATATEETAQNTKPKDAPSPRTPDELSR